MSLSWTAWRIAAIAAIATTVVPVLDAGAQGPGSKPPTDSVSAPIANVTYDLTYDRRTAPARAVGVRMTFTTDGTSPVLLSLPAWTPGAYEISNFSRWVVGFSAWNGDKPLTWDKLDFDTWRIRTNGARDVSIRFNYSADSLDNAMAWGRPDFLLVNGTNVFMYPEGRSPTFSASVAVHTETDWQVATGMTPSGAKIYGATNYHDLVDMPFFIGNFDLDSVSVVDRWVRFASYPRGAVSSTARSNVLSQLSKVIPPEVAVFGEAPWSNYTVMQIVDSAFAGASGLEHQNSHVDILAPNFVGSDFQPSLYAHEIFHSWNVKRLRPSDMWPYVYSRPQPTPWLWVSEGITDYYADLAEVRARVITDAGFYQLTADKINEVKEGYRIGHNVRRWKEYPGKLAAFKPSSALAPGFSQLQTACLRSVHRHSISATLCAGKAMVKNFHPYKRKVGARWGSRLLHGRCSGFSSFSAAHGVVAGYNSGCSLHLSPKGEHGTRNPAKYGYRQRPGHCQELPRPPGDGDDSLLHVGISHLPERHLDSALEVDFRPQLRTGHAGAVGFLRRVRGLFHSVGIHH